MRSACILILATVCCMSGVLTKPQARDYVTLEGHGVCVRAQHQSGKFRIAAEGQCTYDKDRTGQISVELEEIAVRSLFTKDHSRITIRLLISKDHRIGSLV